MQLLFLGTGGVCGVPEWNCDCAICNSSDPRDKRLRSALLVQAGDVTIVVDFGPDLRTQLLSYRIRKLDYAFLTHAHGDHMNGYMELARQNNIQLTAPQAVLDDFFARLGSGREWLRTRNPSSSIVPFRPLRIGGVDIDSIAVEHQKDYATTGTACCGYLFHTPSFSFAYITDFSKILEEEKVRGIDLLIADGNGMDSKQGHAGVRGSIEVFKRLSPKRMLLTHINHHTSRAIIMEAIRGHGNIDVAYDGLQIEVET